MCELFTSLWYYILPHYIYFEKQGVVDTRDNRVRTTTRNLRIREDTARYLLNLTSLSGNHLIWDFQTRSIDVNSAYYDPKARSMRDNPMKHGRETIAALAVQIKSTPGAPSLFPLPLPGKCVRGGPRGNFFI